MTSTEVAPPAEPAGEGADYQHRQDCLAELSELELIRAPWDNRCREVTDYLFPYAGRYDDSSANDGKDRATLIIDSSATYSSTILSAGMMSFQNSRARPWFKLTLRNKNLAKRYNVKVWLAECTQIVHDAFNESNTYSALRKSYDELGAFGTSCTILEPDFDSVLWLHSVTNGRFYLADNFRGEIDTCYRKMSLTLAQLAQEFTAEKLPLNLRADFENKRNLHQRHDVIHAIKPRRDRNRNSRRNTDKPWGSYYFLKGGPQNQGLLRESGYDIFPVLAPRWDTRGGDVYGNGPGFNTIGHIKQLQQEQYRKAQAIDQMSDPARQGPSGLKDKDQEAAPGSFTPVDMASPTAKVQNLVDIRIDLSHLLMDIEDVRRQIRMHWFTELFQAHLGAGDTQKTAEEIKAKTEEKMVLLGPVVSNLDREQDMPLIKFAFWRLWEGGAFPPVPDELAGEAVEIESMSVLAQAQKAIGVNQIDRFASYVGMIAAGKASGSDVWDTFNTDLSIERYADKLSIDPDLIVPGPQRALIRNAHARAQAEADQAQIDAQNSGTIKNLGTTPVGASQPSALDALARLTGVGGAG